MTITVSMHRKGFSHKSFSLLESWPHLNIICGKDTTSAVKFAIDPIFVDLSPYVNDIAFPEG